MCPRRISCIGGMQKLQVHSCDVTQVGAVAVLYLSAPAAKFQISTDGNYVGFIND